MKAFKTKTISILLVLVSIFSVSYPCIADDEINLIIIGHGSGGNGQNREDNVPYEVYLNRTTDTLEIISYDTKPATLYLCDAAGNIVDVLYISGEGLYSIQIPSGYPRLYMMLMSSDIFYAEINL